MESPPSAAFMPYASGTTISGHAQVFNAGRDIIVNNTPPGLSEWLRPVSNATHSRSGPVSKCDPGTRLKVIEAIEKCLSRHDKQAVCWLKGPAGYGKSALSQTIAEHYADKGRLLGSFFFLRGAGDRSRIARLIPTLAHQILVSVPATEPLIEQALRNEQTMLESSASMAHQFQRLIIDPLNSAATPTSKFFSLVIKSKILVIDALDECDDKVQMEEFIDILIDVSRRGLLPFRMLLTSRVEEHIRKKFEDPRAQEVLYCVDLGHFDARPDIKLYFEQEFGRIYDQNLQIMSRVPRPWPSFNALSVLLDKAGSSFMFAITLIQLVQKDPMPHKVLQDILASDANGLDPLYKQVLSSAPRSPAFSRMLGTIMVLQANQSITALSSLLRIQHEDIVYGLLQVQSIIKVPGDDNEPIMLYHTSLRDFLTVQSRSGNYFIDPPSRHLCLAMDCLKCLAKDPSEDFFDGDAERYACLKWPHHILLAFQERETGLDEAFTSSLASLARNLLTSQGKMWYNTVLYGSFVNEKDMLERLEAGKALFQTLQRSTVTMTLFKLFQDVIDFHETQKKSFLRWNNLDDDYYYSRYYRVSVRKNSIFAWRKETELSTN